MCVNDCGPPRAVAVHTIQSIQDSFRGALPPPPPLFAPATQARSHEKPCNRDFKIQRRGRQRERKKTKRFNEQNNKFARASRFFIHFFPVFARLRGENA